VKPGSISEGRETPELLAFLVAHNLGPEWELENIVVAPSARRKGLGARLVGELLTHAREAGSEHVFLEVRESNQPARILYEKTGFEETGRRTGYYLSPPEDAILYRRRLL
jgi:ribosomal-protein-alanine N-acetyltransferase